MTELRPMPKKGRVPGDDWHIDKAHWHFCRRLYDRYGIVLAYGEFSHIKRLILSGEVEVYRYSKADGGRTYKIHLRENVPPVLVVEKYGDLVTVLPSERDQKAEIKRSKPCAKPKGRYFVRGKPRYG